MPTELFRQGDHACIAFHDLVRGDDGIQANQFLVLHGDKSALIDPGGALLYTPLSLAVSRYLPLRQLTYVLASHQDPDIIGSVDRWLMYTSATIVCSRLWGRFIPHGVPHYQKDSGGERYFLLPDPGADIPLGNSHLRAVPAHFLHSVGNFQFFDPVSRILFSGDMGASMVDGEYAPVRDFEAHVPTMAGFHRRYMASNKVCRLWARRVRALNPSMIVPQHGVPFADPATIGKFLDWVENLACGIDLMDETDPVFA
ncbi:MBL fold metallo-hydrolase [Tahibacter harae]|uniref:MBL fold metallo-hydrolase n=1 Tax=Tahibacter harae TaxID=2963937 RepID=A0ABT1QQS6_9GAMM|nr:MBL fold metallo-hydrolase [Tahibacter harae]MCQ4164622.1 MBL fold metallo-hydrolase [Tahibacter harae]